MGLDQEIWSSLLTKQKCNPRGCGSFTCSNKVGSAARGTSALPKWIIDAMTTNPASTMSAISARWPVVPGQGGHQVKRSSWLLSVNDKVARAHSGHIPPDLPKTDENRRDLNRKSENMDPTFAVVQEHAPHETRLTGRLTRLTRY